MIENKMKKYLGHEYSENNVKNYINYWIKSCNKPRKSNDLDCIYYEGDLRADTLFSVWTPLKIVLDSINPGMKFYKKDKYGNDLNKFLKIVKCNIDYLLPKDNELVQELYLFTKLAETKANYFK